MTDKVGFNRATFNLVERLTRAVEDTAEQLERLNENMEDDDD